MRTKPLTVATLIELLSEYPADTPIFDGRQHDMFARSISEMTYDDWEHATRTDDGETPAVGRALSIGPRF